MDTPHTLTRRGFLRHALLPALAAVGGGLGAGLGVAEAQEQPATQPPGDVLTRRFVVGEPDIPPLDSPITFARGDTHDGPQTHQVLSLIQDEKGPNSFPWTLYAQLRTAHTGGDAVGLYARLYKDGPGWSCGVHSEVFSKNWGVGIGVNIEVSNQYEGTEGFNGIIGIEMQSLGPKPALAGLQIEGKGGFETGIRMRGEAQIGVDVTGQCAVGMHLRQNSLRLNEGSWVELDGDGKVRLRYHEGNIELWAGEKRIAHLPVTAEDHAL